MDMTIEIIKNFLADFFLENPEWVYLLRIFIACLCGGAYEPTGNDKFCGNRN